MKIYFRSPILLAFRKSPLENLVAHSAKTTECLKALEKSVKAYCEEDYENASKYAEMVSKIEHEGDLIKGNIRSHLPKGIWMPFDKRDFLTLLKEQDSVMDYSEDVVQWLCMRKTRIPDEIKELFLKHLMKVLETVEALEKVVSHSNELIVNSLSKKRRASTKKALKEVHKLEGEADEINKELTQMIFNLDKGPLEIFILLKAVDLMDQIANHAENAGDMIRAMMAK
ncbi:TIGR00153 family protein [bacterium]|nr:TIGR00153 family protein [bacterium]